jgi:hypothetical protein
MKNADFYVDLSTREAELLKNIRKRSFRNGLAVIVISFSAIFIGTNAYFNKQLELKAEPLRGEIAKNNDLKIANQRTIDENRQVSIDKTISGSIYNNKDNVPLLTQSLDGISPYINSNTLGEEFEVYGGIYEQLANAVKKSNDSQLKDDIRVILKDGHITFDEYRNLRRTYDLDAIMDQYEANKLRDIIDQAGGK